MSDETKQQITEETQPIITKEKKFNWANLPIISVLILFLVLIVLIALGKFITNDISSLTGAVYFASIAVISLAHQLFTLLCFVAFIFQIINKQKTLWDKIFLTLNLIYIILFVSYICLFFAYMKQIKVN